MLDGEGDLSDEPNLNYLGGHSPYFWICAYANNQHRVDQEIGGKVSESSFALAMALARGTVSVVDEEGITFSRIWCVYELFVSVVKPRKDYTYDLYTALEHTANDSSTGWKDEKKFAVG